MRRSSPAEVLSCASVSTRPRAGAGPQPGPHPSCNPPEATSPRPFDLLIPTLCRQSPSRRTFRIVPRRDRPAAQWSGDRRRRRPRRRPLCTAATRCDCGRHGRRRGDGDVHQDRLESGIGDKMDNALPAGSGGVIAVNDTDGADNVDGALATAVKKSVAHIDHMSANELKGRTGRGPGGDGRLGELTGTLKADRGMTLRYLRSPLTQRRPSSTTERRARVRASSRANTRTAAKVSPDDRATSIGVVARGCRGRENPDLSNSRPEETLPWLNPARRCRENPDRARNLRGPRRLCSGSIVPSLTFD